MHCGRQKQRPVSYGAERSIRVTSHRDAGHVDLQSWPAWPIETTGPTRFTPLTLAVDGGLITAAIAAVVTGEVILWFHLIFVLLVIAALMFPLRQFALRAIGWVLAAVGLVLWAVHYRDLPRAELVELPILTLMLVMVFMIAQARARSHEAVMRSQRDRENRADVEREAMQDQLEQSQRLEVLGRTNITLAHEMRNVLTVVRGCAAEMADHPDSVLRGKADVILNAVERGVEMLGDLVTAGRPTLSHTETLNLTTALPRIEPLLSHLVSNGVRIRINVPDEPVEVRFDRTGLMQVVMNLVTNAADAIEHTGLIEVGVRSISAQQPGDDGERRYAAISVTDSGVGLPTDDAGNLFIPGFTTKQGAHSGLGLPTAWRIAARAGGTIKLESAPGGGTTASVLLPLAGIAKVASRCLLGVTNHQSRDLLVTELFDLGFEVQLLDDPARLINESIDLAILDTDHRPDANVLSIQHIVELDLDGPWPRPRSAPEAAELLRRIVRESPPFVDPRPDAVRRDRVNSV
mgnify:CR=1 FL=1